MRIFVALDVPEAVRAALRGLVAKIRPSCETARWVRIEGAHVTLKFIGEVPPETVDPLKSAMKEITLPAAAEILFRGVGFFPNQSRPRVLWAGVEKSSALSGLAAAVQAAIEPLGIARDGRTFSPHLTLARFESSSKLDALRAAILQAAPFEFGRAVASEFHLYQSVLKPGGAEYTRLATFHFVRSETR